jgi:hypothetical protein
VVSSPLGAGQALPRRLFPPVRPGVGTDDRLVVSRQRAFEERPRRLKVALRRATGRHPVAASCRNSNCRSAARGHAAAGQPQPAASAPPQAAAMSEVTAWPKRSIPVAGSTRLGALSATAETLNETARVLATFRRKNNSPSVWSVDVGTCRGLQKRRKTRGGATWHPNASQTPEMPKRQLQNYGAKILEPETVKQTVASPTLACIIPRLSRRPYSRWHRLQGT